MKLLYKKLNRKKRILLYFVIALTFIFVMFNSFATIVLSVFINLLQSIQDKTDFVSITIWEQMFSNILNSSTLTIVEKLIILVSIIISLVGFGFIIRVFARIYLVKLSMDMMFSLRNEVYNHILYLDETTFNTISPTSMINRINNDMYLLQEAALNYYSYFYESLWYLIINIIFSITLNQILSTIYIVFVPLCITICYVCQKKSEKYYNENLISLDTTNQIVRENILGIRIIKAFNLQSHQYNRFQINNKQWLKTIVKGEVLVMLTVIALYVVLNVSIVGILIFGGFIAKNNWFGGISVGVIVAFINYIFYTVFVIYGLTVTILSLIRVKPVINRIKEILSNPIENLSSGIIPTNFVPSINFKNINFSYNSNSQYLNLKNINITINPNEMIGIVGPTGSGKSTLVSLIANLYQPTNGEIKISGIDIKEINLNFLRNQIGFAFQNKFIFAGTIKSNILDGNKDATETEIKFAAKNACAEEFIENLPAKYDNVVNQYGSNLSGGQKQRLSLTRALVRNPKILILDDTLSALDNLTRDLVLENIKTNYKSSTKIIVSQQIKTIKNADRIFLMDKGEIVAIGNHEELLKNSILYKQINESQQTIGDA